MKKRNLTYSATLSLLLGAFLPQINAADSAWTGLGADDLWSTAGNWSGVPDGTSGSSDVLTLGLDTDTTPDVDTNSPWYLESLVLAGSGTTTLTGNKLSMVLPSSGYMISTTGTGSYTINNDIDVTMSSGTFLQMSSGSATALRLNGDITLGAAGDSLQLRGGASGASIYGEISGVGDTEVNIFKTDTGSWRFYNSNNQIGKIYHQRANIRLGADNGFGDGVELDMRPASGHSASVSMQGFTQRFGGLTTANASATAGSIEFFSYNAGGQLIYDRDSGAGDQTFSGRFGTSAAAGQLSITKEGTNTFTLTGDSEYIGTTAINEGTLALADAASISESSGIAVAAGATFDVSGLTSGFTLGAGQALTGNGSVVNTGKAMQVNGHLAPESGTFTIDGGSVALGSAATMAFELGTVSDQILLTNAATINLGAGTLGFSDIVFTEGDGFDVGIYTLIAGVDNIAGTLDGSDLSGVIGSYAGTLQVNGSSLELTVIPEPSTFALASLIAFSGMLLHRRKRSV